MADEEKKSTYRGFTKAQEKAHKKYMENFVEIKVRMTKDKREIVQNHAKKMGLSTTQFINDAIDERMIRDNAIADETSGEATAESSDEATAETTDEATADDETTDELPFDPGDSRESYTSASMEIFRQKEQEFRELCRELAEHEERMKDLPFS